MVNGTGKFLWVCTFLLFFNHRCAHLLSASPDLSCSCYLTFDVFFLTYVKLCDLFVEWHDSYSTEYTCDWYSDDGNCQAYSHGQGLTADQFEYDGLTAGEACCSCGGGTTGGTSEGSGEELLVANKPADFKPSPHLQMTSSSFDK